MYHILNRIKLLNNAEYVMEYKYIHFIVYTRSLNGGLVDSPN